MLDLTWGGFVANPATPSSLDKAKVFKSLVNAFLRWGFGKSSSLCRVRKFIPSKSLYRSSCKPFCELIIFLCLCSNFSPHCWTHVKTCWIAGPCHSAPAAASTKEEWPCLRRREEQGCQGCQREQEVGDPHPWWAGEGMVKVSPVD